MRCIFLCVNTRTYCSINIIDSARLTFVQNIDLSTQIISQLILFFSNVSFIFFFCVWIIQNSVNIINFPGLILVHVFNIDFSTQMNCGLYQWIRTIYYPERLERKTFWCNFSWNFQIYLSN